MSLLAANAFASTARAAAPAAPAPTIQQQIDALLKHRTRPEPLPVDPPNPFVLVTKGIRDTVASDPGTKPAVAPETPGPQIGGVATAPELVAANSAEVLAAAAVKLKVGGMLRLKDQVQLVINDVPRKEGDFISAVWSNSVIQIRIVKILPGQLILRLDDAEVTLKF